MAKEPYDAKYLEEQVKLLKLQQKHGYNGDLNSERSAFKWSLIEWSETFKLLNVSSLVKLWSNEQIGSDSLSYQAKWKKKQTHTTFFIVVTL